ncbi:hypothetical protein BDV93DRAFT_515608 [Ceratobasidium sp. AG-I]|nr:hypothetical protein BDV93DRAFT_515608 [Ceratobasidium sp. AG-I]
MEDGIRHSARERKLAAKVIEMDTRKKEEESRKREKKLASEVRASKRPRHFDLPELQELVQNRQSERDKPSSTESSGSAHSSSRQLDSPPRAGTSAQRRGHAGVDLRFVERVWQSSSHRAETPSQQGGGDVPKNSSVSASLRMTPVASPAQPTQCPAEYTSFRDVGFLGIQNTVALLSLLL